MAQQRLTGLVNFPESGTGPYTYTPTASLYAGSATADSAGLFANTVQSGVDFTASITEVLANSSNPGPMIGLTTSATVVAYTALAYCFYAEDVNSLYKIIVGSTITVTNGAQIAPQTGDIMQLRRVGSTLYGEVARSATPTTFTIVHTFSTVPTTAFYVQVLSDVSYQITAPSGTGLTGGSTVAGAPTIGTATAGNASASVTFTAPASNGGAAITGYTAISSPGGFTGTLAGAVSGTITVTGLTNGTAYTFTVTAQNSVGSSAASAASNSVTPTAVATAPSAPVIGTATAGNAQASVTFTAPASNGGSAITGYTATSSLGGFTGTLAGATAGTITVTGLTNGTSYTFTVTATNAVGTSAASAASNSVTPVAGAVTVSVTDSTIYFSPYNWVSDGAGALQANNVKGSSTFAYSNMRGAYIKFKATVLASGSITLNINTSTLSGLTAAGCPTIAWSVGNGAIQNKLLVSGDTTLALASALAAGTYEVFVWFQSVYITQDGGSAQNYTAANNIFKITSIMISAGGSTSAMPIRSKTMIVYGDSITEGDLSNGGPRSASSQESHYTYGWHLGEAYDAEVAIIGFYGQTWAFFDGSWPNYISGTSRLVGGLLSPAPNIIVINYGQNDGSPGPASSTITTTLANIATAAPKATIIQLVPFSGTARTNITAATRPANGYLIDLARPEILQGALQWSYDGTHPNQRGHANLAALLSRAITLAVPQTVVQPNAIKTISVTFTNRTGTAQANLTGLKWEWSDVLGVVIDSGAGATTNVSGVFSVTSVHTNLAAAGIGYLKVTNSSGAVNTTDVSFEGAVAVA